MACKCSELDWRDVDQTAEHHPACTSGMRKYEGYGLLGDGQPVRLEEITESLLMLSEEKDFVSDLSRIPEWKGDGHTKEDCEKRFSDSSFGVDATARIGEFNFDAVFLELLEKHKDAIAEIVIAHIVNHTELGNQLLLRSSARQDVTHSAPLGRRSFLLCPPLRVSLKWAGCENREVKYENEMGASGKMAVQSAQTCQQSNGLLRSHGAYSMRAVPFENRLAEGGLIRDPENMPLPAGWTGAIDDPQLRPVYICEDGCGRASDVRFYYEHKVLAE